MASQMDILAGKILMNEKPVHPTSSCAVLGTIATAAHPVAI
jgi:hypothetical protein